MERWSNLHIWFWTLSTKDRKFHTADSELRRGGPMGGATSITLVAPLFFFK
jgi:hypothetical protein